MSRCQLRGGVHLEQSYVNDVCLSPRFNQCVFYEEELSERDASTGPSVTAGDVAGTISGRAGARPSAGGSASASGSAGRGPCCGELGDPQRAFGAPSSAGTNGKGSVLALAGSALRAAGVRAGETPKPHLISYRERLQIDGRPIDPATFARLVSEVLPRPSASRGGSGRPRSSSS